MKPFYFPRVKTIFKALQGGLILTLLMSACGGKQGGAGGAGAPTPAPPPPASPPDTRITVGPAASSSESTASFLFEAIPAAGASFTCQLDEQVAQACSSPHSVNGLGLGAHRMTISARNSEGADPSPAQHNWTVTAPPPPPSPPPPPPSQSAYAHPDSPLGLNLSFYGYFTPEWTFIDLFRTARIWFTSNTSTFDTREQASIPRDAAGWPTRLPAANDPSVQYRFLSNLLFAGTQGNYPAGDYTVLYEGEGSLQFSGDARRVDALSAPGREIIRVATPSNNGIILRLTATNPANHLRNLRVIMPGYLCNGETKSFCPTLEDCDRTTGGRAACESLVTASSRQIFHPKFLADLAHFRVIRAIHYFNINANLIQRWDQRTRLESAYWFTDVAPPLELLPLMGNAADADVWVNSYIRADDDFVRNHARLVRDSLRAPLKAYIELSNEVWNRAPPYRTDGDYAQAQGDARWPGQGSAFERMLNWHGLRSQQVCRIWKQEWGAEAHRVQCVMGSQVGSIFVNFRNLTCPLYTAENPANESCARDMALAIGPYFGASIGNETLEAQVQAWTTEDDGGLSSLFTEINTGGLLRRTDNGQPVYPQGALGQLRNEVLASAQLARDVGVPLISYEGGQHIVGLGRSQNNAAINTLFAAANNDARMAQAHDRMLADWQAAGGQRFAFFNSVYNYSPTSYFAAKRRQDDDSAAKWAGLVTYVERVPCWWEDCSE